MAKKKRPPKTTRPYRKSSSWAVLTPDELARPGAILLGLLFTKATSRGIGMDELAKEVLGISYAHLSALRRGRKDVRSMSDELIVRIAKFLGMPKISVMLEAGQVKAEDFYPDPDIVDAYLETALNFIKHDPKIGSYMPATLFVADREVKLFLIILYEEVTGKPLIPGRPSIKEIIDRHNELAGDQPTHNH